MTSDRGCRLKRLHWSCSFSALLIGTYIDVVRIDGTHKTNIYENIMVVTTIFDSSGVSTPADF